MASCINYAIASNPAETASAEAGLRDCGTLPEQSSGVELPEPVATVKSWTNGSYWRNYKLEWHGIAEEGDNLYTEQQVRALLAGVKESLTVAPAVRATQVGLTDEQRRGLQADCSGPIPGAAHRGGRTALNRPQTRMDAQSNVVAEVLPEIIIKALDWIENDTRECVRHHIA